MAALRNSLLLVLVLCIITRYCTTLYFSLDLMAVQDLVLDLIHRPPCSSLTQTSVYNNGPILGSVWGADLCNGRNGDLPTWRNWDGYQSCSPVALFKPVTEQQIIDIIQYASSHNLTAKATFSLCPPSSPKFSTPTTTTTTKRVGLSRRQSAQTQNDD